MRFQLTYSISCYCYSDINLIQLDPSHIKKIMILKFILTSFVLSISITDLIAAPYIPGSLSQVLETIPINAGIASKEFKKLRAELNTDPNNVALATQLAQKFIERSRIEGDPRYLGYAQAVLGPWWKMSNPPIEIMVLRATLLQSTHHFDESILDLDKVLKSDPNNGQAWVTRATILQVQGKYVEAYASCEHLYKLTSSLITVTCATNIRNLSGQAASSYQKLKNVYAASNETNPTIQVWVLTLLAEMAVRQGDNVAAEQYFQQAMKVEDPDSYLLGAYSDFLLDQKRSQEVVKLLKTKTKIDALLLRYTEALLASNATEAGLQIETLKQRFAAALLRNDTVHQREYSRFELRLMHNPIKALQIAKLNWEVQKEPADARVYLEAAIAAKDKASIQTMLQWLATKKLEDVTLNKMATNYQSASTP